MMRLSADQIEAQLKHLGGWKFGRNALTKQLGLAGFQGAVRFVNAVVEAAERAGHHSDIPVSSPRVTITPCTREAGGVTRKDIDLAITIEGLAVAHAPEQGAEKPAVAQAAHLRQRRTRRSRGKAAHPNLRFAITTVRLRYYDVPDNCNEF